MKNNSKNTFIAVLTVFSIVLGAVTVISSFLILCGGIIAGIFSSYTVNDTSWLWIYFSSALFTATIIVKSLAFKSSMHTIREIVLSLLTSALVFSSAFLLPLIITQKSVLNIAWLIFCLLILACVITIVTTAIAELKKLKANPT